MRTRAPAEVRADAAGGAEAAPAAAATAPPGSATKGGAVRNCAATEAIASLLTPPPPTAACPKNQIAQDRRNAGRHDLLVTEKYAPVIDTGVLETKYRDLLAAGHRRQGLHGAFDQIDVGRRPGNPIGQAPGKPAENRDSALPPGAYRGEAIVSQEIDSTLVDAAEELCLYVAEHVEHCALDERKIDADMPVEVLHAEEINAYLDAARTFDDPQRLAALCKRMQSALEWPLQLARQTTQDPAGQYMLLQHALRDGIDRGIAEDALAPLRDALSELIADRGPEIRASLNTIGIAAEFSDSQTGIAGFQSVYRDVVIGEATLAQTLKLLLQRLCAPDGDNFLEGLQGIIRAIGHDLASVHPSAEPERLQSLVQDLYQLEVVNTVFERCRALSHTLASHHGIGAFPITTLMQDLIDVTQEKWVAAGRFSSLCERLGAHEPGAEIATLAGFRQILSELPVKVFSDADIRQSIIGAAQEALDGAIERDEE